MRQSISGVLAAIAVMTVSAAPAMACGGGLLVAPSACAPCAQAYVSPCGEGYVAGYDYGVAAYERLPDPSPQYFYVNQGPTYSGPGDFAPVPTYQEAAVSGWNAYQRGYYYGYDGGRYAHAMHHHYDGEPAWGGPVVQSYRWHGRHHMQHHGYRMRHHMDRGVMYHHSMRYAPRYSVSSRYGYPRNPTLRRYY
jgi:hypothetical protein